MYKLNSKYAELLKYRNLLYELVVRDIKVRYRRSVLGLLWTLLNPLMMMTVMTLVFSFLFRMNIPYFPVYFLTGNILFAFLSESSMQGVSSITANASLIKRVYVPKYLFPLSRVLSCLVNFLFAFIALLFVIAVTGAPFHATLWLSFIPVAYLFIFIIGLSLLLSAANVFFRDVHHIFGILMLVWSYMTPIFYPTSIVKDSYSWIYEYNPMYYYISYFRELVLNGTVPGWELNMVCLVMGLVSIVIGLIAFNKSQDKFILHI